MCGCRGTSLNESQTRDVFFSQCLTAAEQGAEGIYPSGGQSQGRRTARGGSQLICRGRKHTALDLVCLRNVRRKSERVRVCVCVHVLVLVHGAALVAIVDDRQLVQQGRRLLGELLKNLQHIER